MNFTEALKTTFSVGSGRKQPEGAGDYADEVTWAHTVLGFVILTVVQLGLVLLTVWQLGSSYSINLAFIAFAGLAAPFFVFAIAARLLDKIDRLPAALLYFALTLAGLQLLTAALSSFGAASSGFLLGLLVALMYLTAKNFLQVRWPGALLITILALGAFLAPGIVAITVSSSP